MALRDIPCRQCHIGLVFEKLRLEFCTGRIPASSVSDRFQKIPTICS